MAFHAPAPLRVPALAVALLLTVLAFAALARDIDIPNTKFVLDNDLTLIRRGAEVKLGHFGIWDRFAFGA